MSEFLSYEEIVRRYPNEWILLAEPKCGRVGGEKSGRVVFHSPDVDEMYAKAVELKLPHWGTLYTGDMNDNDNEVFVL